MNTRFGKYGDEQVEEFLKRIHGMIHWLLIYKEKNSQVLDSYFDLVQRKICGMNSLFGNSPEIIDLAVIVEEARLEYEKGIECDNKKYRSIIFDAHSAVDRIVHKEEVEHDV